MRDGTDNFIKAMFFCFVLSLFVLCHTCYMRGRESVQHNGNGAAAIREELNNAGSTAAAITGGLSEAQRTAQEAEATARHIESIIAESGDAIKDSKRILRGIRERGATEETKN